MSNRLRKNLHGLKVMPVEEMIFGSVPHRLQRLGIPVIPTESVKKYQRRELRKARRPVLSWSVSALAILSSIAIVIAVAAFFFAIFMPWLLAPVGISLLSGLLGWIVVLGVIFGCRSPVDAEWRACLYSNYRDSVPLEISERASLVRREILGAGLVVVFLEKTPDPFLMVVDGQDYIYIGVWGEDGFIA